MPITFRSNSSDTKPIAPKPYKLDQKVRHLMLQSRPLSRIAQLRLFLNRAAMSVLALVLLVGTSSPAIVMADSSPSDGTGTQTTTTTPTTDTTTPTQSTPTDPTSTTTPTGSDPSTGTPTSTTPSTDTSTAPSSDPSTSGSTNPTQGTTNTPTQNTSTLAPTQNSSTQGPQSPTGPDGNTYTFNPATGMWENQYYIWNPVTKQTTPKTPQTYSYNPNTGMWDTTQWQYDAAAGKYKPAVVASAQIPLSVAGTNTGTGPNSGNVISLNNSNNGFFNNFYNASISGQLNVTTTTGDASVSGNTLGGNATTGDASSMANILNVLQSSTSLLDPNATTFVSNIYGNVQGDITINPSALTQSSSDPSGVAANNLTVNSANNQAINNDVNLASTTGNASVSGNTTGGNATSGNANAVANVVNMLNSMISAKQSFLGVVNIYGNLNGNILMPQEFLDQLLAANVPTTTISTGNLNSSVTNNQSINNNVTATATTGSADVSHNTTGGSATTGTGSTNITVFNLTGSQYIGADTMLVFVNVLGKWVGVLMNAPAGSTAAAYGSGVSASQVATNNTNVNATNNQTINNNINLASQSGDASVTNNTKGGNATSGNANAAVNLLNLNNDQFSLSHWFGILFINVFGDWNGNFGVATPAVPQSSDNAGAGGNAVPGGVQVFSFTPTGNSSTSYGTGNNTGTNSNTGPGSDNFVGNFQLVSKAKPVIATTATKASDPVVKSNNLFKTVGIIAFATGLVLLSIERFTAIRHRR